MLSQVFIFGSAVNVRSHTMYVSSLLMLRACALQSHASQKQCGLTSAVEDELVGLVQKEASLIRPGEVSKLYGASSVGHAASGKLLSSQH